MAEYFAYPLLGLAVALGVAFIIYHIMASRHNHGDGR